MQARLFWIPGPWKGRLAMMPRPRGGDWLEDEIRSWKDSGIAIVVSFLTREEQAELDLLEEKRFCLENGIEYLSYPIPDRQIPASKTTFSEQIEACSEQLLQGKNIVVHCRQGIGRAALAAIALLCRAGVELNQAIEAVSAARGCPVPETAEQSAWLADLTRTIPIKSPRLVG